MASGLAFSGWSRTPLPSRVAIVTGFLLLLTGLGLLASLVRNDVERFRRDLALEAVGEMELLAISLSEAVIVGDFALVEQILQSRAMRPNIVRIAWADARGEAIEVLGTPSVNRAPGWFRRLAAVDDIRYSRELSVGGAFYGNLHAEHGASAGIQEVWMSATRHATIIFSGIALCMAVAVGFLVRQLRPFASVAAGARRFGAGDYGHRIAARGAPEARACIDAFNRMAGDISHLVDSLQQADAALQAGNAELASRATHLEDANARLESEVTERRAAETALRESEAHASRLARIVEQAADGILTRDMDGRITSWNAAAERLFGFTAAEALGQPLGTLHQAAFTPDECAQELARIRAGVPHLWETERMTRDGLRVQVQVASAPIYDANGVQCGELSVLRDVGERKRNDEEMRQARAAAEAASVAKSQFLANMSHEIRTPMNGVLGMSELLLDTTLDDRQREFARAIHQSGKALLGIINDILDFSKIEAGKLELEHRPFDLREQFEEATNLLAVVATRKGLDFTWCVADDVPASVAGDSLRVRQVITNLAGNALKFTSEGIVSVTVTRTDDERLLQPPSRDGGRTGKVALLFQVKDTGPGIPPEALKRLFTVFSQADESTTRRYGGTGLGLAISRQLVEAMGGRIGVESRVGRGSTFWFTVRMDEVADGESRGTAGPAITARAQVVASRAAATPVRTRTRPVRIDAVPDHAGGPRRVLLAEDNPINRRIALTMLEALGYEVTCAANGREAVEQARASRFDVILMDCQMPELDGIAATVEIRALESDRDTAADGSNRVPIVALTANAINGDRERCLEAGMNDYLSKPFAKQDLARVVARWTTQGAVATPA